MRFLLEVHSNDSACSMYVGQIVVLTTVAAKATQSRSPVEVMLIDRKLFRAGKLSLLRQSASMSPSRGDRLVGLAR